MLIEEFMPQYDFSERHEIEIMAAAANVYGALNEVNLCESPLIRGLFFLRGLPSEKVTLNELRKIRFETLGKTVNRELLLGLAGKFWTIRGDLQKIDSRNFREFNHAGYAKAVWDFSLDVKNGETLLTTETRIQCLDEKSRKNFGFYWMFIRPFSGLIRKEMLKLVKRKAECVTNEG